jgi:hypothetical protein
MHFFVDDSPGLPYVLTTALEQPANPNPTPYSASMKTELTETQAAKVKNFVRNVMRVELHRTTDARGVNRLIPNESKALRDLSAFLGNAEIPYCDQATEILYEYLDSKNKRE